MKHLIKTVSFLSVMAVIPGAFAATSRASIIGQATSRLPSIAGYVNSVRVISGSTTSTTGTMGVSECMEEYSECIRQEDACGENFEECTTNVLFHLQMPKCDNILLGCNTEAISMLFGNGSVSALSEVASYVQDDKGRDTTEVNRYTYPTDNSKLGEWIQTAWKVNSLNAQQCSKKYTTCLKRDSVCGADFELCTSKKEFKKQAVFCASTLARCAVEGKKALFGSTTAANDLKPDTDSVIDQMIVAGAGLAAGNAVNTCYKVADQCLMRACGSNPARCMIDKENAVAEMAELVNKNQAASVDQLAAWAGRITARDKKTYIRNMCQETIGNNKFCYMTHVANGDMFTMENGKSIKPEKFEELVGTLSEFERKELYDEVFDDIYDTRMQSVVGQRIADLMSDYDAKTRDKCSETIRSCVMRTCGGGVGAVCWNSVFGSNGTKHINSGSLYDEIQTGCQAIVASDPNCQYSAVVKGYDGYWTVDGSFDTFANLFPKSSTGSDPLGVVASLEGALSTSYNPAAISNMEKQCKGIAKSCVESMCGDDFQYCYRTRTDITLASDSIGAYNTGSNVFDKSMNKQTGVLDYNIAIGLCMDTVENAKVCDEHLKILAYVKSEGQKEDENIWGNVSSVAEGWGTAAHGAKVMCTINVANYQNNCQLRKTGANSVACKCSKKSQYEVKECGSTDSDTCMYDLEVGDYSASRDGLLYKAAVDTVLRSALAEVELKAQAQYKSRLQREQNVCYANNQGGIKDNDDLGSAFRWVKLNGSKAGLNTSYEMDGLSADNIVNSNDLFGSFCAARVTLQIDDPKIKKLMEENKIDNSITSRYFAVGDSFVCGSWISQSTLDTITDAIADSKKKWGAKEKGITALSTLLGVGAGGFGGGLLGEYIATGKVFGSSAKDAITETDKDTYSGRCVSNANKCTGSNWSTMYKYCNGAVNDARRVKIDVDAASQAITEAQTASADYNALSDEEKKGTDGTEAKKKLNEAIAVVVKEVQDLGRQCQDYADTQNRTYSDKKTNKRDVGIGVGTTLGAAAGGLLGAGIAVTAIKAKQNKAANKAVQEWLDEIGQHIKCYVGTQYVGSYGDSVGLSLSDAE